MTEKPGMPPSLFPLFLVTRSAADAGLPRVSRRSFFFFLSEFESLPWRRYAMSGSHSVAPGRQLLPPQHAPTAHHVISPLSCCFFFSRARLHRTQRFFFPPPPACAQPFVDGELVAVTFPSRAAYCPPSFLPPRALIPFWGSNRQSVSLCDPSLIFFPRGHSRFLSFFFFLSFRLLLVALSLDKHHHLSLDHPPLTSAEETSLSFPFHIWTIALPVFSRAKAGNLRGLV